MGSTSPALLALLALFVQASAQPSFLDRTHPSQVFGAARHYRIFLPPAYGKSRRRYPVIYYFHGHSDRYTLEAYDHGTDTLPKIAAFVATHDVIVVAPDGFVARDYSAFYSGTPYDVRKEGGDFDFGVYFVELVSHIDATYRSLPSRRFRATSGLSMGGFMSLYLSARYPDLIGSASAFNPGPEFYIGEKGRRSLWRPKDHVLNHEPVAIRLVRASGDYISQYHEETRIAYAATPSVQFEFRQDEYHRHWATSIAETFDFHMRAFSDARRDAMPPAWNYDSPFGHFSVNGFSLNTGLPDAAIIYLRHVSKDGFGIRTRKWAPDGPPAACAAIALETSSLYSPGASYRILDLDVSSGNSTSREALADWAGRLHFETNCSEHEFAISGADAGPVAPLLLPLTAADFLRVPPGQPVALPLRVFNPSAQPVHGVHLEVSTDYPTVEILKGKYTLPALAPGTVTDLSREISAKFTAGEGAYARVRLNIAIHGPQDAARREYADVLVEPVNIPPPLEVAILDGRTLTLPVFRQRGNQGGGATVLRTVSEGEGNGNGILEPGEHATIWVRVRQGLDPFDKDNWRRAKVYSDSPWLREVEDIQEQKGLEWTSAMNRTSLVLLSPGTPRGASIRLLLDTEGWSFSFTPDVRYGPHPLYQAFQIHNHQLFALTITYP